MKQRKKVIISIFIIGIFLLLAIYTVNTLKINNIKNFLNNIKIQKEITPIGDIKDDKTSTQIKEITLDNPTTNMIVGENQQITVIINPKNASDDEILTWTSSNYKVAKVDKYGYLTAIGYGTSIITVTTSNGKSDSFELNVTYKNPIFNLKSGIVDMEKLIIKKIQSNITASSLYKSIENNENLSIYDEDGELMCNNTYLTTYLISTGNYIEYFNSDGKKIHLDLSVTGDLSGDGEVDSLDISSMMNHISEKKVLNKAYLESAYLNNDNDIDSLDLAYLMNHIAGKEGY